MFATPHSFVMTTQSCDYCESTCDHYVRCENRLHGIKACNIHRHLASRDVRAWFRANARVKQQDFLAAHPSIKFIRINVPRTDGSITNGGNLSEEPDQFLEKVEGAWMIRVLFLEPNGEIKAKYIKLQQFNISGVTEEVIQEWLVTLDAFYSEEAADNSRARTEGAEKAEAEFPGIVNIVYNGVSCRAVAPPQLEML